MRKSRKKTSSFNVRITERVKMLSERVTDLERELGHIQRMTHPEKMIQIPSPVILENELEEV